MMADESIDFSNFPEDLIPFVESFEGVSKEALARMVRDMLLAPTDFRVVSDAPWDTAPWIAYRQALRDLPSHPDWPNVEFPDPPEAN